MEDVHKKRRQAVSIYVLLLNKENCGVLLKLNQQPSSSFFWPLPPGVTTGHHQSPITSPASSTVTPATSMSSFTTSINLLWGSSLHLHALCTIMFLSPKGSTFTATLLSSILVTHKDKFTIFVSSTSSSASCLLDSSNVSEPNTIAGLITV